MGNYDPFTVLIIHSVNCSPGSDDFSDQFWWVILERSVYLKSSQWQDLRRLFLSIVGTGLRRWSPPCLCVQNHARHGARVSACICWGHFENFCTHKPALFWSCLFSYDLTTFSFLHSAFSLPRCPVITHSSKACSMQSQYKDISLKICAN